MISYFTSGDESMYLASSKDGFQFETLNGGKPVLSGNVGTATLRDPFIGRGPDKRFHLLATDGWSSTSIVHACSESLDVWSAQTLLPVMAEIPGAKNAWAPEFFVDPVTQLAHLIWSSVVDQDSGTPDWLTGTHAHRIWGTTSGDFESFEPARVFFDPGYSVIDATVQPNGAGYVMAFKDERGSSDIGTPYKHIAITTFPRPGSEFSPPVIVTTPMGTPSPVEGPSLFHRGDEWILIFDYFAGGGYGALATIDWVNWYGAEIALPFGMRHASVLAIPEIAAKG